MFQECMLCNMKQAILGCMGGEPKVSKEYTRGITSKGKPERTPVYQRISRSEDISSGLEPVRQGSRRIVKPRTRSDYKPAVIRQLPRETRPGYQPRQRSPLSRSRRPSSLDFPATHSDTRFRLPTRSVTGRIRSPQGQGQRHFTSDRDEQDSYDRDAKEYERQYKRDLIIRQAAKLPLWEYTYEDGKPIRGILKNPKYIRDPGLDEICFLEETERSKEAFMDMLATRYPQYAEKISSTASEDGFPVRGRSRDPRRRATVVTYNPQVNRSVDYDGTMSEVDAPTFHRGGFVRSSLPATRSPPAALDKPLGLVFLIFRDETKKALLPNEITHLDTVRALFVRSFPGKLTMSFLESPKRKIYLLDPKTNIYYQLEDLRDIKDRAALRVHETDSSEPQRVLEKPEVRGRTLTLPPGSQGFYGSMPASAITSQVNKAQTLPTSMQPVYMTHDHVIQSPARTSYERSRSLTPDPSRSANYAQNPIYGRMGISPERPPPPQDRTGPPDRPPTLRTIPENHQMYNGNKMDYSDYVNNVYYQQPPGAPAPSPVAGLPPRPIRQAMSPPAVPTGPRADPGRRAFSPPPNLKNYDYIQVVQSSQAPPGSPQYIVKGVRGTPVSTPQRPPDVVVPTSTDQSTRPPTVWRERSPMGQQSGFGPPLGAPGSAQRTQSYRVAPTSEREAVPFLRPRSFTPQPSDLDSRSGEEYGYTLDRIDKMEAQLANLAHWVQSAVVQSGGSTGAPSSVKSTSSASVTSDSTSPLIDSASSKMEGDHVDSGTGAKGLTDLGSDQTATLSQDMKDKILAIKQQADNLRSDLRSLRRLQQINKESIVETVDEAWKKIRKALSSVPGAEHLLVRQQRSEADVMCKIYLEDKAAAEKELADLEQAVEELRTDVLSRQCRVQMSDVEGMALVLSHVTKALGELKARFPKLQEQLKAVMAGEMEVIIKEEKFLKEEPENLDNSLKKCKKLTGTLFTLKRLASVQEHRPAQVVALAAQARIPTKADRQTVMANIQAMVPNHDARVQSIMAAESARQRKKKITTQQEALRFGKSLEIATKALKSSGAATSSSDDPTTAGIHSSSVRIVTTLSPRQHSDTSSVISFVNPMSTSTPKNLNQPTSQPTTSKDSSQTSPSMSYPVMSLIQTVSPKSESVKGPSSSALLDSRDKTITGHKSVEFKSEPAILPVTSSQSSKQKTGSDSKSEKLDKPYTDISSQKSAARAAFFSSLSSPTTPTTSTPPFLSSVPTTESPTEIKSKASGSSVSPFRGIPSLVRSSAVSMPYSSVATSVSRSQIPSVITISKPSTLPVSGGSTIVSSQKFSPASPSSMTSASSSARSKTTFTAIPKPYSPTKTIPSPVTPESPKYRIQTTHIGDLVSKKTVSTQSRDTFTDSSNKKVFVTQSRDSGAKPKKVPPPPPPRKSSRLPGHAVLAVNAATLNGTLTAGKSDSQTETSLPSDSTQVIRETIIDPPKEFATPSFEKSKSDTDKKPMSKKVSKSNLDNSEKPTFIKDLPFDSEKSAEAKISKKSDMKQSESVDIKPSKKPDTKQSETSEGKTGKSDKAESSKSKDTSNNDEKVPLVNGDKSEIKTLGNGIDSSSSSSSIDSQQEVVWLKRDSTSKPTSSETKISVAMPTAAATTSVTSQSTSTAGVTGTSVSASPKKPKPQPPERRSSLTSKTQTDSYDPSHEETKVKRTIKHSSDNVNAKHSSDKQEESSDKNIEGKSKSSRKETKDSSSEIKERKV